MTTQAPVHAGTVACAACTWHQMPACDLCQAQATIALLETALVEARVALADMTVRAAQTRTAHDGGDDVD